MTLLYADVSIYDIFDDNLAVNINAENNDFFAASIDANVNVKRYKCQGSLRCGWEMPNSLVGGNPA